VDPLRYPCRYEGGFKGMRSSDDAVLEFTDEQFSVSRPKTLWARTFRIWAKWTAVTGLAVHDAPQPRGAGDGGEEDASAARVLITTRLRGTGEVVVHDTDADELWEVLHAIGDLATRFPRPTEVDADDEADGHDADDLDVTGGDDAEGA
jgi:hypothetical protein